MWHEDLEQAITATPAKICRSAREIGGESAACGQAEQGGIHLSIVPHFTTRPPMIEECGRVFASPSVAVGHLGPTSGPIAESIG
jgi:hypothetical protein